MPLLGHRKRFLFLHVIKTAGDSIRVPLAPFSLDLARVPDFRAHVMASDPDFYAAVPNFRHAQARHVRSYLGSRRYEEIFSFCFVRNPWDWLVSLYSYIVENERHPRHNSVAGMSFPEFVQHETTVRNVRQSDWITDGEGRQIVSYVGKFETLEKDCETIFRQIGISTPLPHLNRTHHREYRSYYDKSTRNRVSDSYARDIDMFEYSF